MGIFFSPLHWPWWLRSPSRHRSTSATLEWNSLPSTFAWNPNHWMRPFFSPQWRILPHRKVDWKILQSLPSGFQKWSSARCFLLFGFFGFHGLPSISAHSFSTPRSFRHASTSGKAWEHPQSHTRRNHALWHLRPLEQCCKRIKSNDAWNQHGKRHKIYVLIPSHNWSKFHYIKKRQCSYIGTIYLNNSMHGASLLVREALLFLTGTSMTAWSISPTTE